MKYEPLPISPVFEALQKLGFTAGYKRGYMRPSGSSKHAGGRTPSPRAEAQKARNRKISEASKKRNRRVH